MKGGGEDPDQLVLQLLGTDTTELAAVGAFWERVETNLQAGKIRLIFLADQVPSELRRIVEFLNTYTSPVEVLAVEVRQFVGEGLRALVPRVIGQTAQAQGRKASRRREGRKWDEPSFFRELATRTDAAAVEVAHRMLTWARAHVTRVWWGEGTRNGSFVPILAHKDRDHQLFAVWTNGGVEIYFYWYQYKEPFDSEQRRRELLRRLNTIDSVSLPDDAIDRRPSIPLVALAEDTRLEQFFEIFGWVIREIQSV